MGDSIDSGRMQRESDWLHTTHGDDEQFSQSRLAMLLLLTHADLAYVASPQSLWSRPTPNP